MQELHQVRRFASEKERVKTGPIMFGDDRPGIFIRGDEAFAHTFALKAAIEQPSIDPLYKLSLQSLLIALESSDCRNNDAFPAWHFAGREMADDM